MLISVTSVWQHHDVICCHSNEIRSTSCHRISRDLRNGLETMIRLVHSLAEDDQELLQIQASNSWCNLDRVSTYLHNIKVSFFFQNKCLYTLDTDNMEVCIIITDHEMELGLHISNWLIVFIHPPAVDLPHYTR